MGQHGSRNVIQKKGNCVFPIIFLPAAHITHILACNDKLSGQRVPQRQVRPKPSKVKKFLAYTPETHHMRDSCLSPRRHWCEVLAPSEQSLSTCLSSASIKQEADAHIPFLAKIFVSMDALFAL
jgi:hypothetical protein